MIRWPDEWKDLHPTSHMSLSQSTVLPLIHLYINPSGQPFVIPQILPPNRTSTLPCIHPSIHLSIHPLFGPSLLKSLFGRSSSKELSSRASIVVLSLVGVGLAFCSSLTDWNRMMGPSGPALLRLFETKY